jgi:hypothetical protein
MIYVSGKTQSGNLVLCGLYKAHATYGLPLDIIFEATKDRGMIPDWQSVMLEAVESGMSEDAAMAKIEPAIVDSFGSEMARAVLSQLKTPGYYARKLRVL